MRQLARLLTWLERRILDHFVPSTAVQANRRRPLVGHHGWRRR
jgi:hypothetical protein